MGRKAHDISRQAALAKSATDPADAGAVALPPSAPSAPAASTTSGTASMPRRHLIATGAGVALGAIAPAAMAQAARSDQDGSTTSPAAPQAAPGSAPFRDLRPLQFPRDLGSHNDYQTEWWYLTGHAASGSHRFGFQVTFFRSRVAAAATIRSRLAARQLLFAHAAVTDLDSGHLLHDQRIARWNGEPVAADARLPHASTEDTDVAIGDWSLRRVGGTYQARVQADGFALRLDCQPPSPAVLLQGDGGLSRKGPLPAQFSWYYSVPQLRVQGAMSVGKNRFTLDAPMASGTASAAESSSTADGWGRAWLDHEWSDELLDRDASGWDWIGMNLFDGGALTAFRLRRADGGTLFTGGSMRQANGQVRIFGPGEARFEPGKLWTSPHTQARYPVEWRIDTPVGTFRVAALLDDQELDSRASTGAVYWEGVSALTDGDGKPVGRGYLEMTGYAGALKI